MINEKLSRKIATIGLLCMCMVVGLHINVQFPVGSWRYGVHQEMVSIFNMAVPMFFVISGFLLAGHFGEQSWWSREVRKRMKSLVIPFVFWNAFYLLFSASLTMVAGSVGGTFGGVRWSDINLFCLLKALGFVPPFWCQLPFMWFVRCLIVFACFAPLFTFAKWRKFGAFVILFEFAFYFCLPLMLPSASDWTEHFLKYAWMKGICYFSLGTYLRWNGEWISKKVNGVNGWIFVVIGLGLLHMNYGDLLAIPLLMIGAWKCCPDLYLPKWLTSSVFPIFLLHSAVITGFMAMFRVFDIKRVMGESLIFYFVQWLLVIVVCVGLTLILRRLFPKIATLVFGGR